jgi:DNA-binding MarR family transcriptional regulator
VKEDNNQLVKSLERLLISIGRWIKVAHRQCIDEYKDLDVPQNQYKVLQVLKDGGPYKMMELGEILHTSSGSLTVMVDRLVAKHMVERFFMEEDRRVIMVDITEVGLKALEQFRAGLLQLLAGRIDGYDTEKKHRIAAAVIELQEVFEDLA